MVKTIQLIPKNISFPEARVLGIEERELYTEAKRKTAEKFGIDSLAYKTITNGIDTKNITGSQFFWNTNLGFYLPKNKRVISLGDMEAINDLDESFFKGFYSDTPEIILRTGTLSLENNKYILENLVKQVKREKHSFSPENPLRILGLELVKDKNSKNNYGLLLKIGKDTVMINDKRFAYSNDGKKISFGEKTKTIWTKKNSLSRVYLGGYGDLYSRSDVLAGSYDNGRVVVVDAEGVAPQKLDASKYINKHKQAKQEYFNSLKRIRDEIDAELR